MTSPPDILSLVIHRVVLCLLAVMCAAETGCISQRLYDRVKAETVEQSQALDAIREDIRELDREIAGLQALNRQEDAAMSDLRTAIQREEEQLPTMRQRAEGTLAALKAQVASLMNQSWHLARQIGDLRQESAVLHTKVAQYKHDMETARAAAAVVSKRTQPLVTPTILEETLVPAALPVQEDALPQVAHTPSLAPSSANSEPSTVNSSWIDVIINWFITIWNWLLE